MINWIKQFKPTEWPEEVIPHMNPVLFHEAVFPLRLQSGIPMKPSPLVAGHIRTNSGSTHSIDNGRMSTGTDLFVPSDSESILKLFTLAQRIPGVGGFGIYFDTKPSVMIHVDTREEPLNWLRVEGEYIYDVNSYTRFHSILNEQLRRL